MQLVQKMYQTLRLELYLLISSLSIACFLGFIDEGYYNFYWMKDIVAIVALSLYGLGIYIVQLLVFSVLLSRSPNSGKIFAISFTLLPWLLYLVFQA
ncbi:MAG: hypothetical protein KI791_22825 [Cyclobacteriaceae bacterium]|nr:hypothetical protein [Cyclobacteriaceae bacterium SS2]